ncbi:hypothetical protein D3C75_861350 [compost metagenome]
MPTASPSIPASDKANDGMSNRFVPMIISIIPKPRPKPAVRIGRTPVMMEPSATARITRASKTPSASVGLLVAILTNPSPISAASQPASRRVSAIWITLSFDSWVTSAPGTL